MHYLRKSLIFFILLFIDCSSGKDTLSTGQTLKDKDFLISAKKTFTLGFFSPGASANRYLGIWNYKISVNKVVWVANRDSPVKDTSGVVSFHTPNSLAIYGSDPKMPIWSTSFFGPGKNYSAQLLDTGNLIVFQEDKKGVIAWQSFDHPTDTWLPEMKLGVNWKTGLNWSLTSWKSDGDPGTGVSTLRMDVIGEFSELSLYQGTNRIWRIGPLTGDRLGEISPTYISNVTYVDNEDGVYMTYGTRQSSTFSVMTVIHFGFLWMSEWNPDMQNWTVVWSLPEEPCDDYKYCGPNSYCDGPSTISGPNCSCFPGFEPNMTDKLQFVKLCLRKRNGNVCQKGEGFVKLSSMKIPDTTTTRVDRIRGLKECEEECLRDCNCTAYANSTEKGIACIMWYGNLLDTRKYESGGQDLFVRVDAVELAQNSNKQRNSSSNKKRKVAAVVTSVGVVAFTVVFILCWLTHKRKGGLRSRAEQRHDNLLNGPDNSTELFVGRQKSGDLPFFDLISLVEATNNFSHENKLGEGGFGSVYKGTLKNGQEIAVKRLSETSKQGLEEFKNEATLIAKHTHRNLVRLLGCCAQQEEKLLIYEFMPNKSLDSLIFDKTKKSSLDWEQRFNIIMGIIRGMVYLHHDCSLRIIHRDLKASNVLLDAHMNPKISDFGMARFFEGDQVEGNTNRVVGTYGYMSPEYAADGTFSIKSDVFSFGVLLLEIITGTKNKSYYNNDDSVNLISKVWHLWREGRALEIVDSSLGGDYSANTVLRCIHVGLLSLQAQAIHRPTMSDIAVMLSYETDLPAPREPGFYFNNFASDQHTASSSVVTHSANEITLSVIEPR